MCSGPKWKREIVPDHKFDFVDTREFTDNGFLMRMKYLWLYIIVLKSFLVYISDIFTAVTMLTTKSWANQIFNNCASKRIDGCIAIPFDTGKWLFVGCIIFSFLLLAYESRKAKKIIASRDISYAFTNVLANNYYSLRSYDHFCFFDHISNSTKTSDDFAFFVFFVFKDWKRVLLADGPRQTINALTLYAIYLAKSGQGRWYDFGKYFAGNTFSTTAITLTTLFTVVVFLGSLLLLIVAGICYVPLLCHIRGNLKEYCCHKVDKRISTVIKRRQKQRLADAAKLARKEANGDYSHLKNKKGEFIAQPLPQPTLPNLSVDDDDDISSMNTRQQPSTYSHSQDQIYYQDKHEYPPPMPAYNPYSLHQPPGSNPNFNPSQNTFAYEEPGYQQSRQQIYDDNESSVNLTAGAAPFSQYSPNPQGSTTNSAVSGYHDQYDPHDVYQGRSLTTTDSSRVRSPPISSHRSQSSSGLAYDDYSSPPPGRGQYEYSSGANAAYSNAGYSNYSSQPSRQQRGGSDGYGV